MGPYLQSSLTPADIRSLQHFPIASANTARVSIMLTCAFFDFFTTKHNSTCQPHPNEIPNTGAPGYILTVRLLPERSGMSLWCHWGFTSSETFKVCWFWSKSHGVWGVVIELQTSARRLWPTIAATCIRGSFSWLPPGKISSSSPPRASSSLRRRSWRWRWRCTVLLRRWWKLGSC